MKGTIFDIKRFAVHDGPGIRTTVFFKGCPLHCWWCHNPEGISPNIQKIKKEIHLEGKSFQKDEQVGYKISEETLMDEILKDKAFYEQSDGGVTFSGGEPLTQPEFLLQMLKQCKAENLHTVVDTSGFARILEFQSILPFTNLFLFDLKLMSSLEHKKYTGQDNQSILNNLDFLTKQKSNVIIRFPVIPGINDTTENLEALKEIFRKRKELTEIHLLTYHNMAKEKYARCGISNEITDIEINKEGNLENIKATFEEIGLKVKIGG